MKLFSLIKLCLALLFLNHSNTLQAFDWSNHPLWVGYEYTGNGRTPGKSGKIDLAFISGFLPSNPIIIEGGAYDGSDTYAMSQLWPKGKIYSFEPIPELFQKLKQKCSSCDNVEVFKLALSDKSGLQSFYISTCAEGSSSSLLPPSSIMELNHPDITFSSSIQVPTTTLDHFAELASLTYIDFLWLDMQGIEPAFLEASKQILSTVNVVYTEVNLEGVYEGAILYPTFKEWMLQQGFMVIREDLPWRDGGEVLFARQSYLEYLHK